MFVKLFFVCPFSFIEDANGIRSRDVQSEYSAVSGPSHVIGMYSTREWDEIKARRLVEKLPAYLTQCKYLRGLWYRVSTCEAGIHSVEE